MVVRNPQIGVTRLFDLISRGVMICEHVVRWRHAVFVSSLINAIPPAHEFTQQQAAQATASNGAYDTPPEWPRREQTAPVMNSSPTSCHFRQQSWFTLARR